MSNFSQEQNEKDGLHGGNEMSDKTKFFEGKDFKDIENFVKKYEEAYSLHSFQAVMTGQGMKFYAILKRTTCDPIAATTAHFGNVP